MVIQSFRSGLYLAAVVVLIAATPVAAGITSNDLISGTGVGPIIFGMTLAQAAQAGVPLAIPKDDSTAGCFFVHPKSPAGLSFMVRDGKIVRADMVAPATLKTVDGFGRGDKEPEILGFYAATSGGVSDYLLTPDSETSLLAAPQFSQGDDLPRLIYEVNIQGGVTSIHAGWVPRQFANCP
jgi:hypothetical protein